MKKNIPVASPALIGNEYKYVMDCMETEWISSIGKYIKSFEQKFAAFCQTKYALACANGTVALHLALMAHNVKTGDEIIIPTLTYVATANSIRYCNAYPVLVDVEPDTWNINPEKIKNKITNKTKGIIVVHLYGHPADMDPILEIAKKHNLFVIEDAAEAHGATYKNKIVGSIGNAGTFSFFGNKIITTGEGGMVVTSDEEVAQKVFLYKGQGVDPHRRYWFPIIGYNYRMTNIQAAIGLAQLENIEWHINKRKEVAKLYNKYLYELSDYLIFPVEKSWATNVYWMYTIILRDNVKMSRDHFMKELEDRGIETRPVFYPMHILPPYSNISNPDEFPVANWISSRGVNLPTHAKLSEEDIQYVCGCIKNLIKL
jgi:perosamine synthetase